MGRRATIFLVALGVATVWTHPALAVDDIVIPVGTVVVRPPGSLTTMAIVPTDPDDVGQTCVVTVTGESQSSVHPGNDLIISSNGSEVVAEDIEREPGAITVANGTLTIVPDFITVTLLMGPDRVFSGGLTLTFDCTPVATTRVPDTVGLVDPSQGRWHLRNQAGEVTSLFYGDPGDIPVMADWNCDGIDTVGLFRLSDAFFYVRFTNSAGIADLRFFAGNPGDIPLGGDFNGDGCGDVALYRPSTQQFFIFLVLPANNGSLGAAPIFFLFGNPGDKPVVGDWDGDGADEVGLHRESTGFFYWRNTLTTGIADGEIFFGDPGDRFVAGDWGIVDGTDTPAVFRPSDTTSYFRHTLTQGIADSQFPFGESGWRPVAGKFGLG